MNNEKILDRAKKMLALGKCLGTTEQERDTALQMAYRLLAKHNLTVADVNMHEAPEPRDRYKVPGWSMLWAKSAHHHIADLFFCEYYYGGKINSTKCWHYFVGKEGNATTAMHMADYIVASILKEGRTRYGDNLCPETRSFALGAVSKLRQRIAVLKEQAAKDPELSSGTALMLVNVYASEKAANALILPSDLKEGRAGKPADSEQWHEGRAFGDKLSLNVRVGNDQKKKLGIK